MSSAKKDIRTLTLDELVAFFEANGEKKFRAKQVMEWLWKKSATSFDQMNNVGKGLTNLLIRSNLKSPSLLRDFF
jgi:23S rRNA (adenine2503-C2)-methyltransferase